MKINLFHLLCLTEIIQVSLMHQVVPRVELIKQSLTWSDAKSYCTSNYSELATAKTSSDLATLVGMAALEGITELWIGLYNDVNRWRFSYNDVLLSDIALRRWAPLEPDNWQAKESCVQIVPSGNWGDCQCIQLKPFICYNAMSSGSSRFVGVPFPYMTWTNAQTYCRTFHTDLASALNSTENDLLSQIASVQGASWFGMYRFTWLWVDGTNATSLPWYPGQPDNYYGNEACGSIYKGLLNERRCNDLHYFFCYMFPQANIQIVKLWLNSDQSVFDPAVQSSILTKLRQKLEELCMLQNITMKWRTDSDGTIMKKIPPTTYPLDLSNQVCVLKDFL